VKIRFGVDVGGVIIQPGHDNSQDTSFFSDNFLKTPPVDGVFEELARIVPECESVHLVSKCGIVVQKKTSAWLEHHNFYAKTGIPRENVMYCLERIDKEGIARKLRLNAFIDDRVEILSYLKEFCPILLAINARQNEMDKYSDLGAFYMHVSGWDKVWPVIQQKVREYDSNESDDVS
jgi:hypothetical protein